MIDGNAKKAPAWFEHNVAKHYPLPRLSDADMIQMVTDIEEVRDLMSLRSYYQAADLRQKELDELWVSQPLHAAKASYGSNYGYYYGKSEVQRWYVDEFMTKLLREAGGPRGREAAGRRLHVYVPHVHLHRPYRKGRPERQGHLVFHWPAV